jgi:hypothetical protein
METFKTYTQMSGSPGELSGKNLTRTPTIMLTTKPKIPET